MKFYLKLSLTLLSLLLVAACAKKPSGDHSSASPTADQGELTLGFLVKQPEEPWFQYEWKGGEKAAAKYGFKLITQGVQDGEKVMAAIDNLAVQGAKGFVICTPDVRLGPAILNRAKQKGLKVVTVDDQFVSGDGQIMKEVPYVGMSAPRIGRAQGKCLFDEMQKRGWPVEETAVCAVVFEELDTARERTDNSIASLKDLGFPSDRIFKTAQKTTDVDGSYNATNTLLIQHQDIKHWLILGMNDTAVLGAVRSMEERGYNADNVIGIGINGTDCIDELRKPATGFFGSMLVSAPTEGYLSTEILYKWVAEGAQPPLDTRTESKLITRENFEQVLGEEGMLK